jgi:hypothetical protein
MIRNSPIKVFVPGIPIEARQKTPKNVVKIGARRDSPP